jgi:predicted peroxiredoxin
LIYSYYFFIVLSLFETLSLGKKKERTMTDKVLVVLSCGTDNPNRATRALFFAMVAKKEGKDTAVFLLDEGVYIAKKGIIENVQAATGDKADDHMTYLQEFGVPILVGTPCAKSRGMSAEESIEGARMATGDQLISMACESAVISL